MKLFASNSRLSRRGYVSVRTPVASESFARLQGHCCPAPSTLTFLLVSVRQGDRGTMGWLLPSMVCLLYESAVHLDLDIEWTTKHGR